MYVTGRGFRDVAGHSGQTWGRQRKRPTDREWTMPKKPCVTTLATVLVSLQAGALSYWLERDCVHLGRKFDESDRYTDIVCGKEILWDVKVVGLCPKL